MASLCFVTPGSEMRWCGVDRLNASVNGDTLKQTHPQRKSKCSVNEVLEKPIFQVHSSSGQHGHGLTFILNLFGNRLLKLAPSAIC